VTLADLGLAVLALATTVIAAKNIPGMLEMAVLQHLPLDAGARYATATVSRYLITIVGLVFVCHSVGLGWSKVQWLIAAISVGLGFGLQEIFANFVSGLIILIERPIRVGDVITIADVSGVVSRIRMRATTVVDGDRKELIIPNKDVITGKVLNWTLSDQVNRIQIAIGIAYGSDTQLAAQLLLGAAQDHPDVLKDPPPLVTFESFGDSSLKFVLRCFLPNLESRQHAVHDLNMEIDRKFRENGIEIAFPQHDVHVRSMAVACGAMPTVFGRHDEEEKDRKAA
jgi:potassium efflux system protein